ncbi:MAG: hypothetical protein ABSD90_00420 [Methylocystis sp.]|jgi:hypothetical protein
MPLGIEGDRTGVLFGEVEDDGSKPSDEFACIYDQNIGQKSRSDGLVRQVELGEPFNNAR